MRTFFTRWIAFNAVGLVGVVVQLGVLALLTRAAGIDVVFATLFAVEAAVLHNFLWHQRWTWQNRPAHGWRGTVSRLVRFHALNGVVSLGGNVLITAGLVRTTALDPVAANLIAILACSLINYTAAHLLVFRSSAALIAGIAAVGGSAHALAGQPAAAMTAWKHYVEAVEKRHADTTASSFFALDGRQGGWRERAQSGGIPMVEVEPPTLDDGKLHHWAGAVYIPRTTVDAVVARLQAHAGRESEYYEEVKASRLIERNGGRIRVFMRLHRDAGPVEATYNTEHLVEYRRASASRWTSRSVSTKIAELARPGTPREREKSAAEDNGFLWKLNAYWRFEQARDGVLVECESVSLSRSVPYLIRPLANGIVERVARESLENTLRSLKAFLTTAA